MRVIASDESRARRLTTAIFHGTSPRGERSSTEAVAEVQMVIAKGKLGQKSQQRRVIWPLREGREIWGVDGAFASMTWRRHCVRDGVAPSANELAWFYMGSDSVTRKAFPKRKKATQCWVTYEREHKLRYFRLNPIIFCPSIFSKGPTMFRAQKPRTLLK